MRKSGETMLKRKEMSNSKGNWIFIEVIKELAKAVFNKKVNSEQK